jgi:glycosyltransferase involved in cell wall biosynthesis
MLVGTPCVASYVGGIPSLLQDNEEGLLYSDGDPYALAGKIRYLFDHPDEAARMGRCARARARLRHDMSSTAKRLIHIYQELGAVTR